MLLDFPLQVKQKCLEIGDLPAEGGFVRWSSKNSKL
jgi:hypothetical protein